MDTGVLLMSHGSPDSLDEIEEYLHHVMKRHPPTPAFVEEIRERYRRIGGRSPLLDITRRQAAALQKRLNLPIFVGMRHWKPFVAEAVAEAAERVERLVGVVMAPHYAPISVGAYHEAFRAACPPSLRTVLVVQWHQEPHFLKAWAERLPSDKKILFTAHSSPVENADPYPQQIMETIQGIGDFHPGLDGSFAYQSRSPDPRPWLEPDVDTVLDRLAAQGIREVAFAPIGFVSDHVEVLYDLDILHSTRAAALGIHATRVPSLNESPLLIEALASVVQKALAS
ncbi:MAG: ferrochelatase [Planctomycetes bacterium]|nr:ferrochelatase [Planctomycetota bacterium]